MARFPLVAASNEGGQGATVMRQRLESEAAAARALLGCTRFATPTPIAVVEAGLGCPVPWSVQTWLAGSVATPDEPGASPRRIRS